jgi:hypothetical protein
LREREARRRQHAVDDDCDRRIDVADLRQAANVDERERVVLRLHQRHVRGEVHVVAHALDACLLDGFRVERRDRGRRVLQAFGASQRRHDDLLERLLRLCRRSEARNPNGCGDGRRRTQVLHGVSSGRIVALPTIPKLGR